jgi:hypothetical protein
MIAHICISLLNLNWKEGVMIYRHSEIIFLNVNKESSPVNRQCWYLNPHSPQGIIEKIAEIMLEKFGMLSLYISNHAVEVL